MKEEKYWGGERLLKVLLVRRWLLVLTRKVVIFLFLRKYKFYYEESYIKKMRRNLYITSESIQQVKMTSCYCFLLFFFCGVDRNFK